MTAPIARGALRFGGDYNPEQWDRAVWDEDMALMAEARVNTVVLGVFSWSSLEPEEGVFTFGWLDEAVDLVHDHAIDVILATPTASPPPWFSRAHPDGLPVTADGVRLVHGSRDTYDPASPAYRAAARRIADELGRRYGTHPALTGWHVHNEYGTLGYGEHVADAFRAFLRRRYETIEALNRAWHTTFWSQGYRRWEDVLPPRATQYLPNPTQVLDFRRCTAAMLLDCYREQAAVLRRHSPHVPVTTNLMLPTWLHYDPWAFGAASDVVSVDHYVDEDGIEGAAQAAFGGDLARSFGRGAPWLLMEQASALMPVGGRMVARRPGDYGRTAMQHVARGSVGALTFQWRAPYAGAEAFHSSMVPHAGRDTRGFREVVALGERLAALRELADQSDGRVVQPRIGIAWEAESWWAAESRSLPSVDLDFLRPTRAAHRAVWRLGHTADLVRLDHDLAAYRVLLIPSQLVLDRAQVDAVTRFVTAGGTVVVWYFSGSFDRDLHVVPGGYSGLLAPLLGVRVVELDPLDAGATVPLSDGSAGAVWTEDVRPTDEADVLATYAGGRYAGGAAITGRRVGAGRAIYLSTELSGTDLERLLASVLRDAGVEPDAPGAGGGVEAVRRYSASGAHLVVINHDDEVRTIVADGIDLLSGARVHGETVVAAGGVLVVHEGRTSDGHQSSSSSSVT